MIGPIVEIKADEQHMFTQAQCDISEADAEHGSQIIPSISSDKRDVIDSWMNNRQNVSSEYVSYLDAPSIRNPYKEVDFNSLECSRRAQ